MMDVGLQHYRIGLRQRERRTSARRIRPSSGKSRKQCVSSKRQVIGVCVVMKGHAVLCYSANLSEISGYVGGKVCIGKLNRQICRRRGYASSVQVNIRFVG